MRNKILALTMTVVLILTVTTLPLAAQVTNNAAGTVNGPPKPYPLLHCLVCGDKVGGTNATVTVNYQGQQMKFCCAHCVKEFKQDPAAYLKKLHAPDHAEETTNGVAAKALPVHS